MYLSYWLKDMLSLKKSWKLHWWDCSKSRVTLSNIGIFFLFARPLSNPLACNRNFQHKPQQLVCFVSSKYFRSLINYRFSWTMTFLLGWKQQTWAHSTCTLSWREVRHLRFKSQRAVPAQHLPGLTSSSERLTSLPQQNSVLQPACCRQSSKGG